MFKCQTNTEWKDSDSLTGLTPNLSKKKLLKKVNPLGSPVIYAYEWHCEYLKIIAIVNWPMATTRRAYKYQQISQRVLSALIHKWNSLTAIFTTAKRFSLNLTDWRCNHYFTLIHMLCAWTICVCVYVDVHFKGVEKIYFVMGIVAGVCCILVPPLFYLFS